MLAYHHAQPEDGRAFRGDRENSGRRRGEETVMSATGTVNLIHVDRLLVVIAVAPDQPFHGACDMQGVSYVRLTAYLYFTVRDMPIAHSQSQRFSNMSTSIPSKPTLPTIMRETAP